MRQNGPYRAQLGHDSKSVALRNLVDGELIEYSASFDTSDSYTEKPWAVVPDAAPSDVDSAVRSAERAFSGGAWPALSAYERGRLLCQLADIVESEAGTLGTMESLDTGKPLSETTRQVIFSARVIRYFGELADKLEGRVIPLDRPADLDLVFNEPLGVCALLTAWNSPMQLMANKLPAALAAGNTVVLRASEFAPASTAHFAELVHEVGLPAGVVNVLTSKDAVAAQALIEHPAVALVSLTGGTATGRIVSAKAGEGIKKVITELGGKSPHIVFEDADLEKVLKGIDGGMFGVAGQSCIAGSRVLVHRSRVEQLTQSLIRRANSYRLGDPLVSKTEMGPLANRMHFERVSAYIREGVSSGATLAAGGIDGDLGGLFMRPTVFVDVTMEMAIVREEIFGPVVVVQAFDDPDEALCLANSSQFGLAAGIWTKNIDLALAMARRVRAGTVWINDYRRVAANAPFGGTGLSGVGRERGLEGILEFTQSKNVMIATSFDLKG